MAILNTNIPNVVKDTRSGAMLNTDKAGLEAYKSRRLANKRLDAVETRVFEMSVQIKAQTDQMEQITSLLAELVGRK